MHKNFKFVATLKDGKKQVVDKMEWDNGTLEWVTIKNKVIRPDLVTLKIEVDELQKTEGLYG